MKPRKHADPARFRELWLADVTTEDIGRQFGASDSWASKTAQRLGLTARKTDTGAVPHHLLISLYRDQGLSLQATTKVARQRFPGLATMTVKRILSRYVQLRPRNWMRVDRRRECVRLKQAGMTYVQIAEALGMTKEQVQRRLRLVLGPRPPGGAPRFNRAQIVSMRRAGHTQKAIAQTIGCATRTVQQYLYRAGIRAGVQQ